ncbi:PhzF family phenazine biosynthesis protein [Vibrio sp. 10N.261.55.A7]|uniref:PhzF family phenazine biosynthesis protein n=1 Tax=Vibrio sp. 10N.261.55.A7 TaxID=1880851 RepID=UPI000C860E3B|nr:PhzF family phenazine biosynthesis protein [Vibrio sp. 10N.261.55.A7]PMJ99089.1 phenazine biosynthesis protein PhzF [Vibrio sp. 10N.261.55.A7]
MKTVEAFIVQAFTANGTGGNPAGVVLNADTLSNDEKLKIAQSVGHSETAFVSNAHDADFELSFFTVTDEVDFCGHVTLAAFSIMHQRGLIADKRYTQRTKAGLLSVTIESTGRVIMEQKLPEYSEQLDCNTISELIGIESDILESTQLPIQVVSTGLPDIIVPVPQGYLDRIQIDERLLSRFCLEHGVIGIHAFEMCDKSSDVTANCRNFAPLFGIAEEAATGSASGALACYLTKYLFDEHAKSFTFEQGRKMGCTSVISAEIQSNELGITQVLVGGFAHEVGKQRVSI